MSKILNIKKWLLLQEIKILAIKFHTMNYNTFGEAHIAELESAAVDVPFDVLKDSLDSLRLAVQRKEKTLKIEIINKSLKGIF